MATSKKEEVQESQINSQEKQALAVVLNVLENKELKGSLKLEELEIVIACRKVLTPLTK